MILKCTILTSVAISSANVHAKEIPSYFYINEVATLISSRSYISIALNVLWDAH